MLLIAKELWDVVVNGEHSPAQGTSSRDRSPEESTETPGSGSLSSGPSGSLGPLGGTGYHYSRKLDAKACTIIMGMCKPSVLQHILLLETAKEQWDTLKTLYAPLGLQQLSAKVLAFTSYKPPESGATVMNISTHLSTLQYEIGAIDPKERPSDTQKRSILF